MCFTSEVRRAGTGPALPLRAKARSREAQIVCRVRNELQATREAGRFFEQMFEQMFEEGCLEKPGSA